MGRALRSRPDFETAVTAVDCWFVVAVAPVLRQHCQRARASLVRHERRGCSPRGLHFVQRRSHFARPVFRDLRGVARDATLRDVHAELLVKHYLVKGRVQGVGFRWFVHREAAEIGLRGWVRNTEDGHVEVVVAGDPEQIAELEAALQQGSRGSRVDAIVQHRLEEQEAEKLTEFRIEGAW